jgi:hypothetical protein
MDRDSSYFTDEYYKYNMITILIASVITDKRQTNIMPLQFEKSVAIKDAPFVTNNTL